MNYEAVIGLEVHAQLLTNTKIFCGCRAGYGDPPNTNVCPVCLGMPGALPVLNEKVVEFALLTAHALECRINRENIFARKNYFYPDLPKGYQISQYDKPLAVNGRVEIELENGEKKIVRIHRVHIEEDAGKNLHEGFEDSDKFSYIDMNRCGVPLIEIVTEPDIRSAEEASQYLVELRKILRYLKVCDGNMEEGSLRCDANMSIRPRGREELGVKTEVKNMNSFRSVRNAVDYEINRQIEILSKNGTIEQETRLWDQSSGKTFTMRTKEESHDYRYFPEPDLVPLYLEKPDIDRIKSELPELPKEKKARFIKEYSIPDYNAHLLTESQALTDYFELACKSGNDPQGISNWILNELLRDLKQDKIEIDECSIKPKNLAELVEMIGSKIISGKIAKAVFAEMYKTGKNPKKIVEEKGLAQITDDEKIREIVLKVLEENKEQLDTYLGGKEQVFGFFIGQVMKQSSGKANPGLANKILREELDRKKSGK